MEDGEEFHNRNSRRCEEHLSVSVDSEHSNFDALNESQNLKIEPSNSKSTTKSVRIFSGLSENPRLHRVVKTRHRILIKNSQKITEPKNEILSRTFDDIFKIKNLLRISFYFIIILLMFDGQFGVESAPVKTTETSLSNSDRQVTNSRTFRNGGSEHWLSRRPKNQKKSVNKNCKEYDITSRAFLADLIFEGTARSRSKRASGRYVTFVIQKILKQKNNLLRPKTQIRLHFGGKANRRLARVNPLNDCPLNSITSSNRAMANVKFGENYYVFADHFGPMNYTAKGEPIVVNKRNLKSIRSILTKNERPPRVLGLQDSNLKINQQLRLTCQVKGRPVPRINWYKDGAPLIPSSHVNVTYYRRNSTIEIKSLELKDGGVYECRATSITGKIAKTSAHVNVWKHYTPSTTDSEKSNFKKCLVDEYCLNGGQCYFIEHLGEHMCETNVGACQKKTFQQIPDNQWNGWPKSHESPSIEKVTSLIEHSSFVIRTANGSQRNTKMQPFSSLTSFPYFTLFIVLCEFCYLIRY